MSERKNHLMIIQNIPKPLSTPKTSKISGGGTRAAAAFKAPQMTPVADECGCHQIYTYMRNDR